MSHLSFSILPAWGPRALALALSVAAPTVVIGAFPGLAESAEVQHVVGKGEKIDQIAKKYGVTVQAITSANKLKDPTKLKPGSKLVIPAAKNAAAKAKTFESAPKHPGQATLIRFGTKETQTLKLVDKKHKLVPGVLPRMARMMRFGPLNIEHPIDPRLVGLLAQVSDHFGGRSIEIVSGFRPKTPTQYTPHSNHNVGKAIDMRIQGVPNEVLRDHCKTYKNVGVGYYPNSLFVHFDVRAKSTTWVDLSKPGEAPKYVQPGQDIDHGTDDLGSEGVDLSGKDLGKDEPSPAPSVVAPAPSAKPSTSAK